MPISDLVQIMIDSNVSAFSLSIIGETVQGDSYIVEISMDGRTSKQAIQKVLLNPVLRPADERKVL